MRVSTVDGSGSYEEMRATGHIARVFLNGQEIRDCHTADEERGEVGVYVRREDGSLMLTEDREQIVSKTLSGKVEIVMVKA